MIMFLVFIVSVYIVWRYLLEGKIHRDVESGRLFFLRRMRVIQVKRHPDPWINYDVLVLFSDGERRTYRGHRHWREYPSGRAVSLGMMEWLDEEVVHDEWSRELRDDRK